MLTLEGNTSNTLLTSSSAVRSWSSPFWSAAMRAEILRSLRSDFFNFVLSRRVWIVSNWERDSLFCLLGISEKNKGSGLQLEEIEERKKQTETINKETNENRKERYLTVHYIEQYMTNVTDISYGDQKIKITV